MFIKGRRRIHIGTRLDERACGIQISVFSGHVEQRHSDQ
jgi:hypothetical protein